MNIQLTFHADRTDLADRVADIQNSRLPLVVLCDGVTDWRNLGMLFRLADATRITTIYLYRTQMPERRHLKPARSVLPFLNIVLLETLDDVIALKATYTFVALERTTLSVNYTEYTFEPQSLLILGAESGGTSPDVLLLADASIHLPMHGINTSINVICAASVAMYKAVADLQE